MEVWNQSFSKDRVATASSGWIFVTTSLYIGAVELLQIAVFSPTSE